MVEAGIASVCTLEAETQKDVRDRLLRGETMRSIAERVNLKKEQIHSFLRTFDADERQQRRAALKTTAGRRRAEKLSRKIARPLATNPAIDSLYARISAAIPRGIDPALREDMISEAYVESLEGLIREENFLQGVRKVRGRVFRAFANPWGDISLDATLGDENGRTLLECIPCDVSAFV
jgi:hypothetical protein